MSNKKEDFSKKYNFNIEDELKSKKEQPLNNTNENKKINLDLLLNNNINNQNQKKDLNIQIEFIPTTTTINTTSTHNTPTINDEEKNKIKIDSKTYFQNLKRKIILNHKIIKIFIDNFYRDEFNNSRKSSYFIFALPLSVLIFFKAVSPFNPLIRLTVNMSFAGAMLSFLYYYNQEINDVSKLPHNDIGKKIRMIKNELVLYSPLAKPILDEDLNKNKKI